MGERWADRLEIAELSLKIREDAEMRSAMIIVVLSLAVLATTARADVVYDRIDVKHWLDEGIAAQTIVGESETTILVTEGKAGFVYHHTDSELPLPMLLFWEDPIHEQTNVRILPHPTGGIHDCLVSAERYVNVAYKDCSTICEDCICWDCKSITTAGTDHATFGP
jgi:hypothetical protein